MNNLISRRDYDEKLRQEEDQTSRRERDAQYRENVRKQQQYEDWVHMKREEEFYKFNKQFWGWFGSIVILLILGDPILTKIIEKKDSYHKWQRDCHLANVKLAKQKSNAFGKLENYCHDFDIYYINEFATDLEMKELDIKCQELSSWIEEKKKNTLRYVTLEVIESKSKDIQSLILLIKERGKRAEAFKNLENNLNELLKRLESFDDNLNFQEMIKEGNRQADWIEKNNYNSVLMEEIELKKKELITLSSDIDFKIKQYQEKIKIVSDVKSLIAKAMTDLIPKYEKIGTLDEQEIEEVKSKCHEVTAWIEHKMENDYLYVNLNMIKNKFKNVYAMVSDIENKIKNYEENLKDLTAKQITDQKVFFEECSPQRKIGCVILFVPQLQICDMNCQSQILLSFSTLQKGSKQIVEILKQYFFDK